MNNSNQELAFDELDKASGGALWGLPITLAQRPQFTRT